MTRYWNYRLAPWKGGYAIFEVYYEEIGGPPTMISGSPITPWGDLPAETKADIELMLQAFDRPVLTEEDCKKIYPMW